MAPDRFATVVRRVGIIRTVGGVTMRPPIVVVMVGNACFARNTGSDETTHPIEHYNLRLACVVGSTLGKRLMGAPLSVRSGIQMGNLKIRQLEKKNLE